MKVTFVIGMSGAGKSHYVLHEYYPEFPAYVLIDFEDLRNEANSTLNMYTIPSYVKVVATWYLMDAFYNKVEDILIECVGMTGQGQAAIRAMVEAALHHKYEVEIVYIRPVNVKAFTESIFYDEQATSLLNAWKSGHPRFCRPPDAECLEGIPMTIVDTFTD